MKTNSALLLLAVPLLFAAENQWALEQSTLAYHISHPLHQVDGVSRAARGKGVCHEGECDFLVAVPVKTFESGDSNRDLHMLQVVRGAEFPMVTVRFRLPESTASESTIHADLDIQFAGQTVTFKQVPFQLVIRGNQARVSGTIPAKMSDFKIEPPSLLGIATRNEIPIRVETTWRRM